MVWLRKGIDLGGGSMGAAVTHRRQSWCASFGRRWASVVSAGSSSLWVEYSGCVGGPSATPPLCLVFGHKFCGPLCNCRLSIFGGLWMLAFRAKRLWVLVTEGLWMLAVDSLRFFDACY